MPNHSVRYKKQLELRGDVREPIPVEKGIEKIKELAAVANNRSYRNGRKRKDAPQTVELVIHLGIDPKQADQMLRGSMSLPKGTGQTKKVIAFCDTELAEKATAAGAIEAGGQELIEKISKGWMEFDVAIAHPSMMGKVGKLGRVLGPQGKMPSPKAGTVTQDVETAVREFAAGKLEYRNDAGGNIHLPVGKTDFATPDLQENIEAVVQQMNRIKPAASKGTYFKKVCLSATRTPSVTLDVG
ncbi:MAG: 50S ribosomal protein L1 [Planctomycetes bacterium]|nr:50S ribosomal protein L1 [Planctomycetota bacterium]